LLLKTTECNSDNLSLEFDVEPLSLLADATMPCGLIVNELLSNALKHAVPPKGQKKVRVTFKKTGNNIVTLAICDNGGGLPKDVNFSSPAILGLQLVNNLVSQLGGTLYSKKEAGFCVVVELPVNIIS
jgi:two-component sensor histidine kinase